MLNICLYTLGSETIIYRFITVFEEKCLAYDSYGSSTCHRHFLLVHVSFLKPFVQILIVMTDQNASMYVVCL